MRNKEILERLKGVPMFAGCDTQNLQSIVDGAREEEFDSGARVVKEGEISCLFYLILDGQVEVRSEDQVLATLDAGNFFGEMALLEELPRSADVIATKPTKCLVISQRDLKEIISSNSDIAIKMLQELCNRLRSTDRVLIGDKERKEFDVYLTDYLKKTLEAGRKEVSGLRNKLTISYVLLVFLSTIMFFGGIYLIYVAVTKGINNGKISNAFFFTSGLGIADLTALFLINPIKRIHRLMGDIGQITLAVNSFRSQVALRLLETSSAGRYTMGKAAEEIEKVTKKSIKLIEAFFEPK